MDGMNGQPRLAGGLLFDQSAIDQPDYQSTMPGYQTNPLLNPLDARYRPRKDRGAPKRTEGASTR